jgi:hypothetical protein
MRSALTMSCASPNPTTMMMVVSGDVSIKNTVIYAQSTNPLREQVFRELERHPKEVGARLFP